MTMTDSTSECTSFFTIKELANHLKISDAGTRRLIDRKKIAHYRVGGLIRVSAADLDDYLSKQRVALADPVQRRAILPRPQKRDQNRDFWSTAC